jgi:hypothetical protein
MGAGYIDFISAYCDRWCERCAFTSRCSAFAAEAAIAMCGDVKDGLELAVGLPADVGSGPAVAPDREWLAELDSAELSAEERAEYDRRERARRARVDDSPIVKQGWAVSMLAHQWFTAHASAISAAADPVLSEALTVARFDEFLVTVKLTRAVNGRDEFEHGETIEADPVQNDWNGSAKLALICLARSTEAWHVIAQASGDEQSVDIASRLDTLQRDVEQSFPAAHAFVRPGFDQPGV